MSAQIIRQLTCDQPGCGDTFASPSVRDLPMLRRLARAAGWACGRRDLCQPHAYEAQHRQAGCPSEAAYRRHLARGEKCETCRAHMRVVERKRRRAHPEWF